MDLPDIKTVADRLKWARKQKGWTQMELAEHAKVTRDVVVNTENGRSERPRQAQQLADALEVPAAWLLFGKSVESLSKEGIDIAQNWESLPDHIKSAIKTLIDSNK